MDNYIIHDIISKGSFGSIYKCSSKHTQNIYALKIAQNLKYEANIYKILIGCNNVSNIIDFFKYNSYDCILLNQYKLNLKQYKELYFNDKNYIKIFNKILLGIISGIKNIHEKGIIHRDIKHVNICLDDQLIPYIIDFGMSKQIIKNKQHILDGEIFDVIGTINFASINSINKKQLSRRDDIESLFYLYMYIILNETKYNNYISNNIEIQKNIDFIYSFLETNNTKKCIKYIRNMKFTQKPNYDYIYKLLCL